MTEHMHQYVFWTKATGPEPSEPMTCIDCGVTRRTGGTLRLAELHPIARDVVLALIAARKTTARRREAEHLDSSK